MTTDSESLILIGFWRETEDPSGRGIYVNGFPNVKDFVDASWNPEERRLVLEHLRRGTTRLSSMGHSTCRFRCGKPDEEMGNTDVTDGSFVWPAGFAHYVEDHGVKPFDVFIEHVLRSAKAFPCVRCGEPDSEHEMVGTSIVSMHLCEPKNVRRVVLSEAADLARAHESSQRSGADTARGIATDIESYRDGRPMSVLLPKRRKIVA